MTLLSLGGYDVVPLDEETYLHTFVGLFEVTKHRGVCIQFVNEDGVVRGLHQQAGPLTAMSTVHFQVYASEPRLQVQVQEFDIWPAYPHTDLMAMARSLGLSYRGNTPQDDDSEPECDW